MLSSWADESCMDIICRPNLITVRDSSQVSRPGELMLGRAVQNENSMDSDTFMPLQMQTHTSPRSTCLETSSIR